MHRALRILEIISFVLQHASDSTRVKCARVCKLWSEVALDLIWDQVGVPTDNLFAILRPDLLPLRLTNEEMLKGVDWFGEEGLDDVTKENWDRFFYYARRVKEFINEHATPCDWHQMSTVAKHCQHPSALPRLRRLHMNIGPDYQGSTAYMTKFFSPTITNLWITMARNPHTVIYPEDEEVLGFEKMLVTIRDRSPNVTDFQFEICDASIFRSLHRGLVNALSGLQRIVRLHLDRSSLVPEVIEIVRKMPLLERLTLVNALVPAYEEDLHDQGLWPRPKNSSDQSTIFPSLVELILRTKVDFAYSCLNSRDFISRIQRLRVMRYFRTTESEFWELLELVESLYPRLTALKLVLVECHPTRKRPRKQELREGEHPSTDIGHGPEKRRYTRPLDYFSSMKNLASLRLDLTTSTQLGNDDVLQLVHNLPLLRHLKLMAFEPPAMERFHKRRRMKGLTLGLFHMLSNEPNVLQTLRVHIYVTAASLDELPTRESGTFGTHLKTLNELCLEHTPIDFDDDDNIAKVSEIIGSCFSPWCKLYPKDYVPLIRPYEDEERLKRNASVWKRIWSNAFPDR